MFVVGNFSCFSVRNSSSVVSDNMDKISHRAVIRYLSLNGLTSKEIHEDMVVTLGGNVPSYDMVEKWDAEFKRDRDSLDEPPLEKASHRHHTGNHCQHS